MLLLIVYATPYCLLLNVTPYCLCYSLLFILLLIVYVTPYCLYYSLLFMLLLIVYATPYCLLLIVTPYCYVPNTKKKTPPPNIASFRVKVLSEIKSRWDSELIPRNRNVVCSPPPVEGLVFPSKLKNEK